jgi:hypothetical protein
MSGTHFDELIRTLRDAGTRRGLLQRLAALSLAGAGATLLDAQESAAGRRKNRRQARHDPGKKKDNRKGKRKSGGKGNEKGADQCANCPAGQFCFDEACEACDVCASGCAFASVQAAIDANPDGTVTICPGSYTVPSALVIPINLTVIGAGQGTDPETNTILQGTGADRVIVVTGGIVHLEALRITGGTADFGGGVSREGLANLTMNDCTVTGNHATLDGGGIVNGVSFPTTLNNCTISGNSAGRSGGGLANNAAGTIKLNDCIVTQNTADDSGGGALNHTGTLHISGGSFTQNTANVDSGAIHNLNLGANGATLDATGCTFSDNEAIQSSGGAILNRGSTATLTNCEISGNAAGEFGGGLRQDGAGATMTLDNTTVSENDAAVESGGMWNGGTLICSNDSSFFDNLEGGVLSNCEDKGSGSGCDACA